MFKKHWDARVLASFVAEKVFGMEMREKYGTKTPEKGENV